MEFRLTKNQVVLKKLFNYGIKVKKNNTGKETDFMTFRCVISLETNN
jgi:hypothetical protein